MKKKIVPSRSKLRAQALKTGATITDDQGKQFNASKKKSVSKLPENAKKSVEKRSQPNDIDNTKVLADAIVSVGDANVRMLAELKQQIAEIKLSMPAPPDSWAIDWVRDESGFTKRTILTPIYNKKTLN